MKDAQHLTLDDIKQAFQLWRESRTSREPTPLKLQKMAVKLMKHYAISQVATKSNHSTLREWAKRHDSDNKTTFIPLPVTTLTHTQKESSPAPVQLKYPNGIELCLPAEFPIEQLTSLISHYTVEQLS